MGYDVTGPVTINEKKSLLVMLLVLALAGGTTWGVYHFRKHEGAEIKPAASPVQSPSGRHSRSGKRRPRPPVKPPDTSPTGSSVYRPSEDPSYVLVKGRGTCVTIYLMSINNVRSTRITRTYPRGGPDDEALAELWETARAVSRMVRDPAYADSYYNATQDQLDKLNALHIRVPRLTGAQQKTINDLFLATEKRKDADLVQAEKALTDAVAQMPMDPAELDAMEDAAAEARTLLRPDQLDLIDGSIDRRGWPGR